jgi:hypothetical protein
MSRFFLTVLFLLIYVATFSQQPVFVTVSGGDLYSIDLKNCNSRFIGATGHLFLDIAFTSDGSLWGIEYQKLYKIDSTNANVTLIGNVGINPNSLVALNDSILLGEFGNKLYKIKTSAAQTYSIGTIGYSGIGDLTWYDNDLYLTAPGQLIKITLNSTNTAILSVTPVNNSSNPIPNCEGVANVSFSGYSNSIIGFSSDRNVYKICHIDGSYDTLCPLIFPLGMTGAATMRLATQVPIPTSCSLATSIENFFANNSFSLFPNPATNQLNLRTNFNQFVDFNIYDAHGHLVKTGVAITNNKTIDTNELPNGIYSIVLITDYKMARKSFIVEK